VTSVHMCMETWGSDQRAYVHGNVHVSMHANKQWGAAHHSCKQRPPNCVQFCIRGGVLGYLPAALFFDADTPALMHIGGSIKERQFGPAAAGNLYQ